MSEYSTILMMMRTSPLAAPPGIRAEFYQCDVYSGAHALVVRVPGGLFEVVRAWHAPRGDFPDSPRTVAKRMNTAMTDWLASHTGLEGAPMPRVAMSEDDEVAAWAALAPFVGFPEGKPLPWCPFDFERHACELLAPTVNLVLSVAPYAQQVRDLASSWGDARFSYTADGDLVLPDETTEEQLELWALLFVAAGQALQDGVSDVTTQIAEQLEPGESEDDVAQWVLEQLDPELVATLQAELDHAMSPDDWELGSIPSRYRLQELLSYGLLSYFDDMAEGYLP